MCKHEHIRFEDGSLYLVCIDCGAIWGHLDRKGGTLQYTKAVEMRPWSPDTRHDRWQVPRTERPPKPAPTSTSSSGTPRQDKGRKG